MKDYSVKDIRNIAVLGHGSEGKTTLVESMLFSSGAIDRQGRVEDGNTVSDFDPEEVKRHISISASVAPVEVHGKKLNMIDVPGYFDFAGEAAGALSACEGALIVMSAVTGISTGFEKAWEASGKRNMARFIKRHLMPFVINMVQALFPWFCRSAKAPRSRVLSMF